MKYVIMGVSGSGKTSVGEAVEPVLGIRYIDGDALHPPENIAKMSAGIALSDEDRWPWLDRVGATLKDAPQGCMIGCSALKRIYRDRIRQAAGSDVTFIYLSGSKDLISGRMAKRRGHFMPAALLDSQFAALEPPGEGETSITVEIDQPLEGITADIVAAIRDTRQ